MYIFDQLQRPMTAWVGKSRSVSLILENEDELGYWLTQPLSHSLHPAISLHRRNPETAAEAHVA